MDSILYRLVRDLRAAVRSVLRGLKSETGPDRIGRHLRYYLLSIISCAMPCIQAQQPTITQYVHTAWTDKDGAPNNIHAIAQTADGFLWIGGSNGLNRFDGLTFEHYEPPSGPALPAGPVTALLALSNGDLWVGFHRGGICQLRNGLAVIYSSPEGLLGGHVQSLAQDASGTLWAGTSTGLARFDGERWIGTGKDWNFPSGSAGALFVDRQGTLWVVVGDKIVFLVRGARTFQSTSIRFGQVSQIAESGNGKLWMAETTRSVRPLPLGMKSMPSDETEVRVGSMAILFARDGDLWITTLGDGLRRVPSPEELQGTPDGSSSEIERSTVKENLTDNVVVTIFQDREGDIWVGTLSGLDRFRKSSFVQIASSIGNPYFDLTPADEGEIWVNSTLDVALTRGSSVSPSPAFERPKAPWEATYRDPSGTVSWIYANELVRYQKGNIVQSPLPKVLVDAFGNRNFPVALSEDRDGVLWMDIGGEGIFCRKKDKWSRFSTPQEIRELHPTTAFSDDRGTVWFGFDEGTVVYVDRGEIHTVVERKGSPVAAVNVIGGRNNQIWIGGATGLAFSDGMRVQAVLPSDFARFGDVSGIQETPDGSLWLRESRGVVHINAGELRKSLETPTYRVHYQLFDALDGLLGKFEPNVRQKEVMDSRGRLWFGTSKGIVRLDPARIPGNSPPPPAAIRGVIADGHEFPSHGDPVLPALTGRLEIDLAGLNLSAPEHVRIRYEMEGTDRGWQDAGTAREAFYTNLAPGRHRFHLSARNVGGEWNARDTVMEFTIVPAWFQTIWFGALCATIAFVIVWALYRIRVRQVAKAISVRFDERLQERTRLARDLHDTLLQTIQGSKLVADSALKQPADPTSMRGSMEQISVWMGRATEEGRTALNSLRTSTTERNDLASAFQRAIEECRTQSSMEASLSVVGEVSEMHPIVRDEVYRIGYEAIRNACAHSQATQLRVELQYDHDLILRVHDNGVGISPAIADGGREGHFGLQGMRERADRIMAKLTVETSASNGTEIKLVVPGSIIYRNTRSGKRKISAIRSFLRRIGLTSDSSDV